MIFVLRAEFAWPDGDRPGRLEFSQELPALITSAMSEVLSSYFPPADCAEARFHALCRPDGPIGRYRLDTREGSWFVRVSSRFGNPEIEKIMTDHLVNRGVSVCPLLVAGKTWCWDGRVFRIDVRPIVEGRHFNGSMEDLRSLAVTLSACHRVLRDFPLAHKVRAAAAVRYQRLGRVCERIAGALKSGEFDLFAEHAAWVATHRDWLAEMVDKFDPHLNEHPDAQCVHGEVHPGNVLFHDSNGAAVLVDFEESTHLFMPPTWDLAFLVQRFCLRDKPSPAVALERLAVIAEGYGGSLPKLAPMMRQAAWFTLATILDIRSTQGVVTPIAEYDKFVELERQALTYEGVV